MLPWLALLVSTVVAAQPPAHGLVTVRLVDVAQTPLGSAEVVLRGEQDRAFQARTDSMGVAVLSGVPSGLWVLSVRRLGVEPVAVSVRIAPGENVYTVQLDPRALTIAGLRIVGGRSYSARLDDFERRRLAGTASATVSREEIDRLGAPRLSRMLRGMAGLRLADSLGNTVALSTRGAKPSPAPLGRIGFGLVPCVMRLAVDGTLMPPLTNIDQVIPTDVHGIEVYFGPARMPPELSGLRTDNWCGLIAIWTRDR